MQIVDSGASDAVHLQHNAKALSGENIRDRKATPKTAAANRTWRLQEDVLAQLLVSIGKVRISNHRIELKDC
ncbi:MAG: hypothetical protein ABH861_04905 [Patescibacteria group bacterium]